MKLEQLRIKGMCYELRVMWSHLHHHHGFKSFMLSVCFVFAVLTFKQLHLIDKCFTAELPGYHLHCLKADIMTEV